MQNLKATMKEWEIVTLRRSGNSYPFDSKFASYNFLIVNGYAATSYTVGSSQAFCNITINKNSYSAEGGSDGMYDGRGNFTFSKSGNNIVLSGAKNYKNELTVLFYK